MQRLRDAEGRQVLAKISNGSQTVKPEELPSASVPEDPNNDPSETASTEDETEKLEFYEDF